VSEFDTNGPGANPFTGSERYLEERPDGSMAVTEAPVHPVFGTEQPGYEPLYEDPYEPQPQLEPGVVEAIVDQAVEAEMEEQMRYPHGAGFMAAQEDYYDDPSMTPEEIADQQFEDVVSSAVATDEERQAVADLFRDNVALQGALPELREAIAVIESEYGEAVARSIVKSPEAITELFEMLSDGDGRFEERGQIEAIKRDIMGEAKGGTAFA
jgi:hypothetical protein